MGKGIFSRTYIAVLQRRFEEALEDEELDDARKILEQMPRGQTPEEIATRATVLIEGYRALVESYSYLFNSASEELDNFGARTDRLLADSGLADI